MGVWKAIANENVMISYVWREVASNDWFVRDVCFIDFCELFMFDLHALQLDKSNTCLVRLKHGAIFVNYSKASIKNVNY